MRSTTAFTSANVMLRPSALATKACKVSVTNSVCPEISMRLTSNARVAGTSPDVGAGNTSPVSLREGVGGKLGCTCCNSEPALGTSPAASAANGESKHTANSG